MAAVTADQAPSLATSVPGAEHVIAGLIAGEAIGAGKFVYVKGSDNLVWLATGAAANEAAGAWGITPEAASAGEAVTIHFGVQYGYKPVTGGAGGTAVAANALLYLTTAGNLDTAATTGDAVGVARVVDSDGKIFIRCHP